MELLGSFTDPPWEKRIPMSLCTESGVWWVSLQEKLPGLKSGTYEFKFLVNGSLWRVDPALPSRVNAQGFENNILCIDFRLQKRMGRRRNSKVRKDAATECAAATALHADAGVTANGTATPADPETKEKVSKKNGIAATIAALPVGCATKFAETYGVPPMMTPRVFSRDSCDKATDIIYADGCYGNATFQAISIDMSSWESIHSKCPLYRAKIDGVAKVDSNAAAPATTSSPTTARSADAATTAAPETADDKSVDAGEKPKDSASYDSEVKQDSVTATDTAAAANNDAVEPENATEPVKTSNATEPEKEVTVPRRCKIGEKKAAPAENVTTEENASNVTQNNGIVREARAAKAELHRMPTISCQDPNTDRTARIASDIEQCCDSNFRPARRVYSATEILSTMAEEECGLRRPCSLSNIEREESNCDLYDGDLPLFLGLPNAKRTDSLGLEPGTFYKPKDGSGDGEDAHFVSARALGVADGVGGLQPFLGYTSKRFAEEIMGWCLNKAEELADDQEPSPGPGKAAKKILSDAFEKVSCYGAATAVVALMDPVRNLLGIASLGDSGVMVIRRPTREIQEAEVEDKDSPPSNTESGSSAPQWCQVVFKSLPQQHAFNYPYQLCEVPPSLKAKLINRPDLPEDADTYEVQLEEGDLVLLYSDGLEDNLHEHEILKVCDSALSPYAAHVLGLPKSASTNPQVIAESLTALAYHRSHDRTAKTPFSQQARLAGWPVFQCRGGKEDDITCVAAWVAYCSDH